MVKICVSNKGITSNSIWNAISCCLAMEYPVGLDRAQRLLKFIPESDAEVDHLCIRLRIALLQKDALSALHLTAEIGSINN